MITDETTCAGGGVGTRLPVPTIGPGESVPVTFRIALPAIRRFRFFVNFFGFTNGLTLSRNTVALPSGSEKGFEVNFTGRGKASVAAVSRPTTDGTAAIPRKSTGSK